MGKKPKVKPDNLYHFKPKLKGEVVEDAKIEVVEVDLVGELMPSFLEFEEEHIAPLQELWKEIAGIVSFEGFLSKTTALAVREIIPTYLFYREANAQIKLEGLTYTVRGGRNGKQNKPHALIGSATAWKKEINSFVGDFGLTPVAKKRLEDVAGQGNLFDGMNEFDNNVSKK